MTSATRRTFVAVSAQAALGLVAAGNVEAQTPSPPPATGAERIRELLGVLAARFGDLRRRFIFEYYPWYGRGPWRHWDQWGRRPPADLASNYVPRLGPYDSRDRAL